MKVWKRVRFVRVEGRSVLPIPIKITLTFVFVIEMKVIVFIDEYINI